MAIVTIILICMKYQLWNRYNNDDFEAARTPMGQLHIHKDHIKVKRAIERSDLSPKLVEYLSLITSN